jgi:hypothetical protein
MRRILATFLLTLLFVFLWSRYGQGSANCGIDSKLSEHQNIIENVKKKTNSLTLTHSHSSVSYDHNIDSVKNIASSLTPRSDKFTTHSYETMYGMFLYPRRNQGIKFLEIGLGCDMTYGPGASLKVWQQLLHPDSNIWMAEYNVQCVDKFKKSESLSGINILTGDQKDLPTLSRWVRQTGGNFDIIIDDGAHTNVAIKNSFDVLWPTVKPGGIYFIEDLQVARSGEPWQDRLPQGKTMLEVIESWIEAILVKSHDKLPTGLQSVFCQMEACAFFKSKH